MSGEDRIAEGSRSDVSMASDTRSIQSALENIKRSSPTLSSRTYTISSESRTRMLEDPELDRESVPLPMCSTPSNDNLLKEDNLDDLAVESSNELRPLTVHDCPLRLPLLPINSHLTVKQTHSNYSTGSRTDSSTHTVPISLIQSTKQKRSEIILDNLRQSGILEVPVSSKGGFAFTIDMGYTQNIRHTKPLPPLDKSKENIKDSPSGLKVRESVSFDNLHKKTCSYETNIQARARQIVEQAATNAIKRERVLERIMDKRAKGLTTSSKASDKIDKKLKLEEKRRRKAKVEAAAASQENTNNTRLTSTDGALKSVKSGRITSSKHKVSKAHKD